MTVAHIWPCLVPGSPAEMVSVGAGKKGHVDHLASLGVAFTVELYHLWMSGGTQFQDRYILAAKPGLWGTPCSMADDWATA